MRWTVVAIVLFLITSCRNDNQMSRVQEAYAQKHIKLINELQELGIDHLQYDIFLRAFKLEQKLEVWVKNKTSTKFKRLSTYEFCTSSGVLGPKRKEGDRQIPEGFYHIDRFNPKSNFHLSLGLNYPNKSDKIWGNQSTPGSDIFIHGGCSSVGCIAITDDKIKELYILAEQSQKSDPNPIEVHIFPFEMTNKKLDELSVKHPEHLLFWNSLKEVFNRFEKFNKLDKVAISKNGLYEVVR